ncbi:MAG: hypothetical protein AAFY11_06955 [Cyanobacteria bacterium J06641_5]
MNTPSHWLLNIALLGPKAAPGTLWAITLGAIAPDLPIFIFYAVSKAIYRLPEAQIWREAYYEPGWQFVVAIGHSMPLAGLGLLLSLWFRWDIGIIFCISLICHSLLDLPVHHDDAHRHFFPLSDFRFESPFSYWDVSRYARWVAGFEILSVLAVTPWVLQMYQTWLIRGFILIIDVVYVGAYIAFYLSPLLRRWG